MTERPNKITGPNAGGLGQFSIPTPLTASVSSLGVMVRRPFLQSVRSLWLFLPIIAVPLVLPSGERILSPQIGKGWPWHYGWQGPGQLPSIVSAAAFVGDLLVGLAVAVILWLLVRYFFGKPRK